MATALVSLLTGRAVKEGVAMTGEITLRGRVLPIGGLKEKVLAAHRAGIRTVILPKRNETDLDEIPPELQSEMRFVPVERVDEVLEAALSEQPVEPPVEPAPAHATHMHEGLDEGVHIIDESTEVPDVPAPDEEPVEVNRENRLQGTGYRRS
jgi:ATP-dependent Lon protease